MSRTLLSTAGLAAAVLLGCPAAQGESSKPAPAGEARPAPPPMAAKAVRVETAKLETSTPRLELVLPGEVEGSREADLATALGGYVEKVHVAAGDRVRRGQAIASIGKSTQDARLEQAEVEVARAQADVDRLDKAAGSIVGARKDAAQFALRAAIAARNLAKINADLSVITAPFAGVIADVTVEEGEVLPPGGHVARLLQLDPIHVTLAVSDRDVVSLEKGQKVEVRTTARSKVFPGKIARVNPAADVRTRAFEVEVEVDNPDRLLLPGMIASVHAVSAIEGGALAVPQDVLVTRREGNGVFVVEGGRARWRPLVLGRVVRDQIVVESGVEQGADIVVTGHRELADGDQLIVSRSGKCCEGGRVVFAGGAPGQRP